MQGFGGFEGGLFIFVIFSSLTPSTLRDRHCHNQRLLSLLSSCLALSVFGACPHLRAEIPDDNRGHRTQDTGRPVRTSADNIVSHSSRSHQACALRRSRYDPVQQMEGGWGRLGMVGIGKEENTSCCYWSRRPEMAVRGVVWDL